MPRKKSNTSAKQLKDQIAELASKAVADADVVGFLQEVVQRSGKRSFIIGTDRNGNLIKGRPPLKDRFAAAKLLLEYAVGKPRTIPNEMPNLPVKAKTKPKTSSDLIDETLRQIERMQRIVQPRGPEATPAETVVEAEFEEVDVQSTDEDAEPPALPPPSVSD